MKESVGENSSSFMTYDSFLPVLFSRLAFEVEIPVLIQFIKTEFGINEIEYLEDGIFKVSNAVKKIFIDFTKEDLSYLQKTISKGYRDIEDYKRNFQ
ncbi:MAG: hypothetical protein AB1393_14455 [Candidatus Edwardsbacteria bacterium]